MGSYTITIHGVGQHHNSEHPNDADMVMQEMVDRLHKGGHSVSSATFTYGGHQCISPKPSSREHVDDESDEE